MREWLKKLRKDKGLTQEVVAKYIGISQHYYSTIETGERQKDLDLSIIAKLSDLFGVTADWIVEQERKGAA